MKKVSEGAGHEANAAQVSDGTQENITVSANETEAKICKYCAKDHRTDGIMEKQHSFSGVESWVCACGYRGAS